MYNDFFDIRLTNKEILTGVLIVLVFLVGAFGCGYLLGVERTEDVYGKGSGAAGVGEQIGQAGADISNAEAGISQAAGTADKIGSGIKDAKESAGYIQHTADTSAELISECQSIIRQIRARGKTDQAAR